MHRFCSILEADWQAGPGPWQLGGEPVGGSWHLGKWKGRTGGGVGGGRKGKAGKPGKACVYPIQYNPPIPRLVRITCYCLWLGSRLRPVGSHLKPTWSPLKPTWSPLEAHLKPSVLMVSFNWSPQCLWLGDDWSWLTVLTVNFWCLRLAFLLIFTMKMDAYG